MENNGKQKNSENDENIKESSKVADKPDEKKEDKVLTTEEKLKETEDKLLRTLAEVENQRRRFEKEIKDAFEFGGFNFAKETLSLLDNLERAKISIKTDETLKDSKDLGEFLKNIEIIEKNLISIFEKNNIKKIKCLNLKFDPNLHQAMLEIEDDSVEPGIVLQEVQPGYMFSERLLRPSFVGVSKKKQTKSDQKDEKK
ncbi:MAG: nucleotide exchange factor GrpE [Candidatus Pelagibacter sp.]|nr:nucleotide exchange factor GrpE [Candidatus Pelagibacter sp.]|tara:strand:+ start:6459 stop:7055 length:597 start_codon:yes stop_codon:yes gene_type:complete